MCDWSGEHIKRVLILESEVPFSLCVFRRFVFWVYRDGNSQSSRRYQVGQGLLSLFSVPGLSGWLNGSQRVDKLRVTDLGSWRLKSRLCESIPTEPLMLDEDRRHSPRRFLIDPPKSFHKRGTPQVRRSKLYSDLIYSPKKVQGALKFQIPRFGLYDCTENQERKRTTSLLHLDLLSSVLRRY